MSPSPRQPPPAWVLPVWICFSGRPHNWDDTVSVLQFLASRTRRDVSSAHACWSVCQYVIHWWSWGTFHFLCSPHCIRPLFRGWAFEWLPLFVCFVYVLLSIPTQILCANMGFNSHIRMAGWYARCTFNLLRNSQTVSKTPAPIYNPISKSEGPISPRPQLCLLPSTLLITAVPAHVNWLSTGVWIGCPYWLSTVSIFSWYWLFVYLCWSDIYWKSWSILEWAFFVVEFWMNPPSQV